MISKGKVRGYASGAMLYELDDRGASLTPSLQGVAMNVAAAETGRAAFQGEAGLTGMVSSAVAVSVGYRHRLSGNDHASSTNATLQIRW